MTLTETRPKGIRQTPPTSTVATPPVPQQTAGEQASGSPPGGGAEAIYGVFSVGSMQVALPLAELREVIPRPATFSQLPARAVGLVGAVNLRHLVIPVLDLRQLIGMEDDGGNDVIVIVARQDQVFGLLADEIRGVSRVPAHALMDMTVAGDVKPLFAHSFEQPGDGSVVSLLDSTAIAGLPGVPVVRDADPRNQSAMAALAGSDEVDGAEYVRVGDADRRTVMLLRCAAINLSIDVRHVHSVIPKLVVRPSPLVGGACHGIVHLAGRSVPVVDPLMVMGLGVLPKDDTLRGIVLSLPSGLCVLSVSDVTNIETVPKDDVLPLPATGMNSSVFVMGALLIPGKGQNLVLDGEALRADPELDNFAGLGMPLEVADGGEAEPDGGRGGNRRRPPEEEDAEKKVLDGRRMVPSVEKYLTYNVGIDVGTPLVQISEILPYPSDFIPLDNGDGIVQGVFTHRRATVPLLSLPTVLGRYEELDRATARVLLVDSSGGYVGFIVPALNAIEESIWLEVEPGEAALSAPGAPSKRLVKVGTADVGRMLPYIDLAKLAASA